MGLAFNALVAFAEERCICNPMTYIWTKHYDGNIATTKITTPEGTYRVFTYNGRGITAIRIQ